MGYVRAFWILILDVMRRENEENERNVMCVCVLDLGFGYANSHLMCVT